MKDYEQLVQDFRKENFDLKLRVHLLEERLKLGGNSGSAEEAHKRVIDLKVEADSLRRELADKKELLQEASIAIETLERDHADVLSRIESEREAERIAWTKRLELVEKEVVAASVIPESSSVIPVRVSNDDEELRRKIAELERQLNDMRARVVTAEDEARLSREELAAKSAEVNALRADVTERDDRIITLAQAVEVKEKEVQEKEKKVQTVQEELKTVKPEIVTKTREIEDKDKIIEEKNSQLEQQQKILVEIQITLDEKQKELEEYERKLRESRDRIKELEDLLNAQLKAAQAANQEVEKKLSELKRRDRRLRDMEAQMKELQDSLNKAKWEAEQGGCASEGGVKEMAEDEMETLWMRLEDMKRALTEMTKLKQEKELEIQALKEKLEKMERERKDVPMSLDATPAGGPGGDRASTNLHSGNSGSAPVLTASMPQQSIHIQPQFAVETGEVAALRAAVCELRGQLEAKTQGASAKAAVEPDDGAAKGLLEMELWSRNADIAKLQKQMDRMNKQHEKQMANLREDVEDRDKEVNRLREKARKLRAALDDARKDGFQSDTYAASVGKENSGSSSTDQRHIPLAQRPLQEANANVFHVYQAGSVMDGGIPAALVPLLAACHEETVDALKMKVEALQTALTSRLQAATAAAPAAEASASSPADLNADSLRSRLRDVEAKAAVLEREKRELVDQCRRELDDHRNQVVQLTDEIRQLRRRREEESAAGGGNANGSTVDWRQKYQNSVKKYKKELAALRKRLADSHNACAMLRTRLEEMADFLDQIFSMEEQGLLDLSHISTENISAMRRSLDQTRDLSRSLSQSLVVAVIDEEPCGGAGGGGVDDDDVVSFSSHTSSFGLRDDGSPATPEGDDPHGYGHHHHGHQLQHHHHQRSASSGLSGTSPPKEELLRIRKDLDEKSRQLAVASDLIEKLRGETTKLAEGIKMRDIEIERLAAGDVLHRSQESGRRTSGSKSRQLDASQVVPASMTSPSTRRKGEASPGGGAGQHSARSHHHHHHHHRPANAKSAAAAAANAALRTAAPAAGGKALSPSESEAWSEPDRNVSLARIGLDQETLLNGVVGAAAAASAGVGAVVGDEDAPNGVGGGGQGAAAPQLSTSSSSDADSQKMGAAASLARTMQLNRKLTHKVKALEVVNDSLKAELVSCHAALGRGEGDQALFLEMKSLRDNLLQAVATQDQIKRHLQDGGASGELRDEREKLRAAQAQADRYRQLCDHSEVQIKAFSQRNEELEKELARLKKERLSLSLSTSSSVGAAAAGARSSERDQRRDLEEWYKVKAVEMQSKDQRRQAELQEALAAAETEKKELKIQLNEAKVLAERQAEVVKELEVRCSRLEDELHKALDELGLARQGRAELERQLSAARTEVACVREEGEARVGSVRAESEAKLVLARTECEQEKAAAARDAERRAEAERVRVAALEAELAALEQAGDAALREERADHLAQVLELKKEIQTHKEKANDLESRYIQLLVENQRLLEAKTAADEWEAKRQQYLDKSLQVDDFDGFSNSVPNGVYGGVDSPDSVHSFDCGSAGGQGTVVTAATSSASASRMSGLGSALLAAASLPTTTTTAAMMMMPAGAGAGAGAASSFSVSVNGFPLGSGVPRTASSLAAADAVRSVSDERSAFSTTPFLNSPAAYSSDQGIESDSRFLGAERAVCPDCRSPLPDIPFAKDGDTSAASMSILQLELKIVREENGRLLSELCESRGRLKDAEARMEADSRYKEKVEKALCRQLHKTHDVLRKASTTTAEKSAADKLERRHHARRHDGGGGHH